VLHWLMSLKEATEKTRMFRTLLKGQALYYFEHHIRRILELEYSEIPENNIIELALGEIDLEYIPKRTIPLEILILGGVYVWVLIHLYNNL
jgi:hypothetical protein